MSDKSSTIWYHSNRYHAQAACDHCQGIVRHEDWCIRLNPETLYAYQIVVHPSKLSVGDSLILHSLGVAWGEDVCRGNCKPAKTPQPSATV
jgi:hypothetical protein